MSQPNTESLREFEQKMHEQGSDGFADGPRPWENWDESGNQANSRVWEGNASRVYDKSHGPGHKFLTLLALVALATLLVGIGGVVYTHIQTPQLATNDAQPHTQAASDQDKVTTADKPDASVTTVARIDTNDSSNLDINEQLNIVAAPAAGEPATVLAVNTADKTDAVTDKVTEATDSTVVTTVEASSIPDKTSAPVTVSADKAIESVSIETVVTDKSVTTTVYTRHPQQQQEVIAAIETTPPPFAHQVVSAPADTTDETVVEPADTVTPINDIIDEDIALAYNADTPARVANDPVKDEHQDSLTLTAAVTDKHTTEENTPAVPAATAVETPQAEYSIEQAVTEPAAAPVRPVPAVKSEQAIMPVKKTGGWVINLSSYTWKSTADRKLAEFLSQGVDAEVFEVTIKDKPMYRIRVTGFDSSGAAKAEAKAIEQTLGLEGAWVSKY